MWPPKWVKTHHSPSSSSSTTTTSPSPRLSITSCSSPSLKDLESLLSSSHTTPTTTSSPSLRIFHRVRFACAAIRSFQSHTLKSPSNCHVVLYFTSLHVIRAVHNDCRTVRGILRGLRVAVDERDLAMDARFLPELTSLLRRRVRLPQVFVDGRHLGGAEEIRRLHESGELRRIIGGGGNVKCERCGGERFVLCGNCDGSRKRCSVKGGGFRSCGACNENGLVRCPDCCCSPAAV